MNKLILERVILLPPAPSPVEWGKVGKRSHLAPSCPFSALSSSFELIDNDTKKRRKLCGFFIFCFLVTY